MKDKLLELDKRILEYINKNCKKTIFDKTMPIITTFGNCGLIWIILSIIFFAKKTYRVEAILILSALLLTTIIGEGIIKHIFKRDRPFVNDEDEQDLLITKPMTYSFPSGHTASSFSVLGVFVSLHIANSLYVGILASLIAFSRLYLNVHYPSDVIIGILLGTSCGTIVIWFFNNMM